MTDDDLLLADAHAWFDTDTIVFRQDATHTAMSDPRVKAGSFLSFFLSRVTHLVSKDRIML